MIRLLRSASVRIALSYAADFIVSTLLLVSYLWWRTANYLDQEIDAVIAADTRAIADRLRDFGLAGALATVADRVKQTADEHTIYLLADPLLNPVGGNLNAWPAEVGRDTGWYEVKLVLGGKLHATRILHVDLPAGFHIGQVVVIAEHAHHGAAVLDELHAAVGLLDEAHRHGAPRHEAPVLPDVAGQVGRHRRESLPQHRAPPSPVATWSRNFGVLLLAWGSAAEMRRGIGPRG